MGDYVLVDFVWARALGAIFDPTVVILRFCNVNNSFSRVTIITKGGLKVTSLPTHISSRGILSLLPGDLNHDGKILSVPIKVTLEEIVMELGKARIYDSEDYGLTPAEPEDVFA